MTEYSLLIVDSDADYIDRIASFLDAIVGIRVVGTACVGSRALDLVKTTKPDVVLVDPLLPELDGLTLMKNIKKMKSVPVIVCNSYFYTAISVELARRNGADYYAYKPIEPNSLASVIRACAEMAEEKKRAERSMEEIYDKSEDMRRIRAIMRDLGFTSKLSGIEYIARSVAMVAESPMLLHNLSSGLYKQVATQMQTSVPCVERSMRTAIAAANENGNLEAVIGAPPTNKTCIRFILQQFNLRL